MENIHKIRENIYITSDEEIKEGDWYYDTKDLESLVPIYQRSQDLKFYSGCKKIILTTDVDLIANGVQAIQEEMKQKTLEEAAERHSNETLRDNSHVSFIAGAKWQQEIMYSEEDMAESFMACWKANVPEGFECKLSFKEWFEQFKKK